MNTPIPSEHAKKRLKERANIKNKSSIRITKRAWEIGIKHNELKGSLKRWVDGCVINSKATPRIYAQSLFLFNSKGVLITIYRIPQGLRKNIPGRKEA